VRGRIAAVLVAGVMLAGACNSRDGAIADRNPSPERSTEVDGPMLVAAGDIACVPGAVATAGECQMEATASLIESLDPEVVAPLGDLQYERGEAANFAASYAKTWGRFGDRTRPAPGNHEYAGGKAPGYFAAFDGRADGGDGRGWYSYDLGGWHVVVLNSVCSAVGGCGEGSAQLTWLRADLAADTSRCTLAYWHHPRWSSGLHGSDDGYEPFWQALTDDGADIVLGGHDHHYERFAPRDGLRQFVVGTGGRSLYPVIAQEANSEVVDTQTFGVLALTLRPDGYDWRFVPVPDGDSNFTDVGSAGC